MKTKFRAFYPETKQMIYGNANHAVIDFEGKVLVMDNISGRYIVPKDCVLMQSTGLHDKNGKEIYGGDIIKFTEVDEDSAFGAEETYITEVCLIADLAQWRVIFPSGRRTELHCVLQIPCFYGQEIIGNIYENPELLESNKVK